MSILYRPIEYRKGNRYLIEDYKGTDDAGKMLNVSLDVPLGAMVFFYTLGSELLNDTMDYLQAQKLERLEITQGSNSSQINMELLSTKTSIENGRRS